MKRYSVNVHYDMVISVEVDAEKETDAIDKAIAKANDVNISEAEMVGRTACVTDVEEIHG